jgi:hypothetical protein
MVVAVVEAVDVEAIKVEVVVKHLQILAALTSTPLPTKLHMKSAKGTWKKVYVSSATRRGIDLPSTSPSTTVVTPPATLVACRRRQTK